MSANSVNISHSYKVGIASPGYGQACVRYLKPLAFSFRPVTSEVTGSAAMVIKWLQWVWRWLECCAELTHGTRSRYEGAGGLYQRKKGAWPCQCQVLTSTCCHSPPPSTVLFSLQPALPPTLWVTEKNLCPADFCHGEEQGVGFTPRL